MEDIRQLAPLPLLATDLFERPVHKLRFTDEEFFSPVIFLLENVFVGSIRAEIDKFLVNILGNATK